MKHFILFTTLFCALPMAAQVKNDATNQENAKTRLENAVERAVADRQQAQTVCPCLNDELSVQELIEAEEELQLIRDKKDPHATFETYPYLLSPAYRHKDGQPCPCRQPQKAGKSQVIKAAQPQELDTRELIAAEEELQHIRDVQDPQASFEKYTYLLDPAYQRGNEETRQKIRHNFSRTHSTWAHKVGI